MSMTTTVLRWETPPDRPTDRWGIVAAELKDHHGEWGVVADNQKNNTLARNIKQATYKAFLPAGTFETRSVKGADGKFTIYARFTNGDANVEDKTVTRRGKGSTTTTKRSTRTRTAPAKPVEQQTSAAA